MIQHALCLESELVEEILNTSSLSVTLGSLGLVLLLENLLNLLAGLRASILSQGSLVNNILQVNINRVSVKGVRCINTDP